MCRVLGGTANSALYALQVIKAAGLRTAYAEKHPSYEVLHGPSGAGVDDLYTPEISCVCADAQGQPTGDLNLVATQCALPDCASLPVCRV